MVVVRAAEVRGKQTSYRGFLIVVTPALLLVFHPLSSLASVTRTEARLHRPTRVMVIIPLMCSADHTAETPKFFAAQTEDEGGREDNTYNISRVCKWKKVPTWVSTLWLGRRPFLRHSLRNSWAWGLGKEKCAFERL